jgi:hypothetical protein
VPTPSSRRVARRIGGSCYLAADYRVGGAAAQGFGGRGDALLIAWPARAERTPRRSSQFQPF